MWNCIFLWVHGAMYMCSHETNCRLQYKQPFSHAVKCVKQSRLRALSTSSSLASTSPQPQNWPTLLVVGLISLSCTPVQMSNKTFFSHPASPSWRVLGLPSSCWLCLLLHITWPVPAIICSLDPVMGHQYHCALPLLVWYTGLFQITPLILWSINLLPLSPYVDLVMHGYSAVQGLLLVFFSYTIQEGRSALYV